MGQLINRKTAWWIISLCIILVWFINGFFCKLLNLVPRHELIVAEILGAGIASVLIKIIGLLEILMCVWIISGIRTKLCAAVQITVIGTMNLIEYFLAQDLLLFGKLNLLLAILLMLVIFLNEFRIRDRSWKFSFKFG